eukprot:5811928-Amphidinium_carterae.1
MHGNVEQHSASKAGFRVGGKEYATACYNVGCKSMAFGNSCTCNGNPRHLHCLTMTKSVPTIE